MATLLDTLKQPIHDTAQALIAHNIPTKLAGVVTTPITAGFNVLGDVLGIVRDLTAPPSPPPTPSPSP